VRGGGVGNDNSTFLGCDGTLTGNFQPDYLTASLPRNHAWNRAAGPSATLGTLACGCDVLGGGGRDTPPCLCALPIVVATLGRQA